MYYPTILICLIRGIWRTIICGANVSGHDFRQIADEKDDLECMICGKMERI